MCEMSEETLDGYEQTQAVNLRGIWTFMKHELLQMKKQGSGAIVNCSSLGGLVGLPGRAAYHASKHGVLGGCLRRRVYGGRESSTNQTGGYAAVRRGSGVLLYWACTSRPLVAGQRYDQRIQRLCHL
jgi:hypothetical protein